MMLSNGTGRMLSLLFILCMTPSFLFADADSDYKQGRKLFSEKKYSDVLSVTGNYTLNYPNDQRNDSVEYMNAVSKYNLRDFNGALMTFNGFESRYPDSGYVRRIHYWSGLCWYSVQKYSKALGEFIKQLEYPDERYYYQRSSLYAGFSLEKLDDFNGASRYYLLTIEKGNDSRIISQALFRSGVAFIKIGEPERALTQFQTLEIEYYDSPFLDESVFYKGEAHFLFREWEKAVQQYDLYLLSMGKSDLIRQSYFRLAQIYMLQEQHERAVEFLTRYYEEFPDSDNKKLVLTYLAEQLMLLEEGEQSRAYYMILNQLADDAAEKQIISYKIAQSFLFEGEKKSRSLDYFDQVLEGPDKKLKEMALFYGGKIRFDNFSKKEAVPYLLEIILDYPGSMFREEAGYYLVQYYMYTGEENILSRLLNGLQKEYPESIHHELYEYLLGEMAYKKNQWNKALVHWEPLLSSFLDPVLERKLKYYSGKIYYDRSQWDRSYPLLEKVASYGRRDDFYADTLFKLAEIELIKDKSSEALKWLDLLIEDFPATGTAGKAWFRKGEIHYGRDADFTSAYNDFKSAESLLEVKSRVIDAMMGQAYSLKAGESREAASELFLSISENNPEAERSDEALYEYILLLKDMEKYREAEENIARILSQEISSEREETLLSVRAEIYFTNDNEKEGYNTLYQLSQKYPESDTGPELLYRQGESYLAKKEYDKAAVWFFRCYEMFPLKDGAPEALFRAAEALKNAEEWKDSLEKVALLCEGFPFSSVTGKAVRLATTILADAFEDDYPSLQEYYEKLIRSDVNVADIAPLYFEYMVLSDYHPRTQTAVETVMDDETLSLGLRNEARLFLGLSYKAAGKAGMAHQVFVECYETEKSEAACRALFEDASLYYKEENLSESVALFILLEQEYSEYRAYASAALKKVYDIYQIQGEEDRAVIIKSRILDSYPGSEAATELGTDS